MEKKSLKKTTPPADLEEATNRTNRVAKLGELYASRLGLNDGKVALQILTQAMNGPSWCAQESDPGRLSTTLGTLTEIGPKGAMETLLAVQMIGVHNAALMFLKRAT